MPLSIAILDGPLPAASHAPPPAAGAWITFEGIVRPLEAGQPIDALHYTAYEPMAQQELKRIAEQLITTYDLLAIHIQHSKGRVPVGACSFRLTIAAPHRKEALRAMGDFIDQLKKDVPIWKSAPPRSTTND